MNMQRRGEEREGNKPLDHLLGEYSVLLRRSDMLAN